MYFLPRNPKHKLIYSFIRLYCDSKKSHYDVLNLRKNCSDKEIKDAYIQMSKEYHPDKNKDAKAQERFVRIVEAYNVLGKPSTRAQYDAMTDASHGASYVYRTHVPYNLRKNPDYSYYWDHGKTKTNNTKSDSYYGVKGVKKLPNYIIILICFTVAAVGCVLQLAVIRKEKERKFSASPELSHVTYALRLFQQNTRAPGVHHMEITFLLELVDKDLMALPWEPGRLNEAMVTNELDTKLAECQSYSIHRRKNIEKSMMLADELEKVRDASRANTNEMQTRMLMEKIVTAANPSVATASLGQALADEKK